MLFVPCGFFFQFTFSEKIFREYHQNINQFGYKSSTKPGYHRACSELFPMVISGRQGRRYCRRKTLENEFVKHCAPTICLSGGTVLLSKGHNYGNIFWNPFKI